MSYLINQGDLPYFCFLLIQHSMTLDLGHLTSLITR